MCINTSYQLLLQAKNTSTASIKINITILPQNLQNYILPKISTIFSTNSLAGCVQSTVTKFWG